MREIPKVPRAPRLPSQLKILKMADVGTVRQLECIFDEIVRNVWGTIHNHEHRKISNAHPEIRELWAASKKIYESAMMNGYKEHSSPEEIYDYFIDALGLEVFSEHINFDSKLFEPKNHIMPITRILWRLRTYIKTAIERSKEK